MTVIREDSESDARRLELERESRSLQLSSLVYLLPSPHDVSLSLQMRVAESQLESTRRTRRHLPFHTYLREPKYVAMGAMAISRAKAISLYRTALETCIPLISQKACSKGRESYGCTLLAGAILPEATRVDIVSTSRLKLKKGVAFADG